MGQKVNPHAKRVGIIKYWDSRYFVSKKEFPEMIVEDVKIRKFIKKKLYLAGISKTEIERSANRVRINISVAKPGLVIGKGGAGIEIIKNDITKLTGKNIHINITEVKQAEADAQLVSESIASQLERRVSFRRAMKQSMTRAMKINVVKGIRTQVSGRVGGAEIARTEHYHEGNIPQQTLRADIDYGFAEANTTYGKIGVKVWIFKGEVLPTKKRVVEGGTLDVDAKEGKA